MKYYAQINSDNLVYAVTQTDGDVDHFNMIEIDGFHEYLLGMRYENQQFVPVEAE